MDAGRALQTSTSQGDVDFFTGSFSRTIPIEVPAYYGLEPQLALTYNSQAGNSFVAVGWRLSGISSIGFKKGFQGYFLDDQELVICSAQTFVDDLGNPLSPSCQSSRVAFGSSSSFFSTKWESNWRIEQINDAKLFDAGALCASVSYLHAERTYWKVTAQNGTVATYCPILTDSLAYDSTFRWALVKVQDTNGHTVTYDYSTILGCDATTCYPIRIKYNGNPRQGKTLRQSFACRRYDRSRHGRRPGTLPGCRNG